jgi:methylenetetrahydrofolate reductase (NADPH)
MVKRMRDDHVFQNGEPIKYTAPRVYIGAVSNPFSSPINHRIPRLEKKVCAGADFIQTQSIFDIEMFRTWMEEIRNHGIDKNVHILAGVTPLKSVKMMKRMKYHVPGVEIPDEIETRMLQASDPNKEGFAIAAELIKEIKTIAGVHGIHITALFWEDIIPSLVKDAGLYPRPKV